MTNERRLRLACCDPFMTYFPRGMGWSHSRHCHAHDADGHPRARQRVLDAERLVDPGCPVHPSEPLYDCRGCEAHAEAILQDVTHREDVEL